MLRARYLGLAGNVSIDGLAKPTSKATVNIKDRNSGGLYKPVIRFERYAARAEMQGAGCDSRPSKSEMFLQLELVESENERCGPQTGRHIRGEYE